MNCISDVKGPQESRLQDETDSPERSDPESPQASPWAMLKGSPGDAQKNMKRELIMNIYDVR